MKSKWLPYGIVLIAVFLVFTVDRLRTHLPEQEKEPTFSIPEAIITVGDQEVIYKSGTFAWVEKGTGPVIDQDEPPILFHDLLPVSVKPFSEMKITFPEKEGIDSISVYRSQGQGDLEMGNLPLETVFDDTYTFNNVAGQSTVIIQASSGDQVYHYVFPLIIEEVVAYQAQLAEERGYLAILELYKPEELQVNWALEQLNNKYVHKAHSLKVNNLEEARQQFPDLKIDSLPYYAIFNHERLLYEAYNREDFFKMLRVASP
ncbi:MULTISPECIES: hypothetical protein [Mesobacillus]|uniref:hypothetical protein n=1 Tax=Mesobacillus TaxID=2675231 RepID=UPI001782EB30|nr:MULTISPECIES: hypothetical protein [Mesobacillus]MCM3575200.1 hypothetical protein [Mesobacillus subterraneus]UYZ24250.1 hypothetical protein FOF60_12215 [Mesobacillus jeotgali]